mgnify:CR=1 FL=1
MTADHDENSTKPQSPGSSSPGLRTAMAAVLVLLTMGAAVITG